MDNKYEPMTINLPTDEQIINQISGLRDQMAMAALQGMQTWIPPILKTDKDHNTLIIEARAEWAYKQADAMLEARKVTK